jgi:FKBP-type peptidyl-prolyl cis-trans isomerase
MRRISLYLMQLFLLMFALIGCELGDSEYEKQVKTDDNTINKYLSSNKINALKHDDGFYYEKITEVNHGTILKKDDVVDFYYKISVINGTVLEEITRNNAEPARFKLGTYTIVPIGLDIAIGLMKAGEKYRFYMPSYLSYGTYGCKEFHAYTNFIIEVEVAAIHSEAEIEAAQLDSIQHYVDAQDMVFTKTPSGLYFYEISPGTSSRKPSPYAAVTIDFTRRYLNDSLIKSVTGIEIYLNHNEAVPGLEEGIKMMTYGSQAQMIMPSNLGFKQSLCVLPEKIRKELIEDKAISLEVKPYSIIKYNVKLIQ